MRQRIAIIGAGVIGLLTARELLHRGHRVVLVDRAQPARAASWAGGGIVSPLYPWRYGEAVSALAAGAQEAHARLSTELLAETGIDPEYTPCGLLMLAPADVAQALSWCEAHGRNVERCDVTRVAQLQPGLSGRDALWMPAIGNVRNPRLLRALLAMVGAHPGAELTWQADVALLAEEGGAVLRVNGRAVDCDAIVVAAGAWSASLLAPFGIDLPVIPVRGQMLLFAPSPGLLQRIVLHEGRYLIPRRDGRIVAGSTLEFTGFDDSTTVQARESLFASATAMMPALANVPLEAQWAGLRPGAPSGIPYIDRVPGTRVYVNAGHFRNGLVLAPAAAAVGVAQLLGESPPVDAAPYAITAPRGQDLV